MALVFVTQHTVTFSQNAGKKYQWELDILRSYDDTSATPSWVTDTPTALQGTGNPVAVEWLRDYEVYKPIQGSRAQFNLVIDNQSDYDAWRIFSAAGRFEYQVRLRYRREGETTLNDYWCGFIDPVDGQEAINTFPFELGFTAVDGLGRLEDSQLPSPTNQDAEPLIETLLDTLFQTGQDLDVYIDSGIRLITDSSDALINATANSYYRWDDEDQASTITRKSFLEGFLASYNCKITQHLGNWHIFNASTLADTTSWEVYEYETTGYSTTATTTTQNLVRSIDSTTSSDLVPVNQDLVLNTRRPIGSVECRPEFTEINYVTNGCFNEFTSITDVEGFFIPTGSPGDFTRVTNIAHPTCDFALENTRNRQVLDSTATKIWFQTDFLDIDVAFPTMISFDHLLNDIDTTELDNARLNWTIELQTTVGSAVTSTNDYSIRYGSTGSTVQSVVTSVRNWYWHHGDGRWVSSLDVPKNRKDQDHNHTIKSETLTSADEDVWQSASVTTDAFTNIGANDAQMRLIFWYGTGKRDNGRLNRQSNTGLLSQLVTNINIENVFENEITDPVYERFQTDYTQTITYEPLFADNAPRAVYQRLLQEGFTRRGDNVTSTLEEIVTQQKLNDFRLQFQYYEGTILNLNNDPFGPLNKIRLNWSNFTSSPASSTVLTSGIFNGGTFNVKKNTFDLAFYIPDQATDAISTFSNTNVDLVAAPFPGRSTSVAYQLGFRVDGLNDNGTVLEITDTNGVNPGGTGYISTTGALKTALDGGVYSVVGLPGQEIQTDITLVPEPGFDASASNMSYYDGTNNTGFFASLSEEDIPTAINSVVFSDSGANIIASINLTLPLESEFEEVHIAGEVDPFVGTNNTVSLTIGLDSSVTNTTISNTMRSIVAPAGSVIPIQTLIIPNDGFRLNSSTFTTGTIPSYITNGGFAQLGNAVLWESTVTIPNTSTSTATITLNGTAPTQISSTVSTSTFTLNFSESIANASLVRTQLVLTGVVGTAFDYDLLVFPASGHSLNSGNFSVTETVPSDNVMMNNAIQAGDAVNIPIAGTFPSSDATATFVVNGSSQAIGVQTTTVGLTFTNNITNSTLSEGSTEVFTGVPGATVPFTLEVTAASAYQFNGTFTAISSNTTNFEVISVLSTDQTVFVNGRVHFGTSNSTSTLTLGGSTTEEPFTIAYNINSTELSFAGSNMVRHIVGYDIDDFGNTFSTNDAFTIQVSTVPGSDREFISNGDITLSPAQYDLISNKVLNTDGTITVTISDTYPSTGSNIERDITISNSTEPSLVQATTGSFAVNEINIPLGGGLPKTSFTANGLVRVVASSSSTSITSVTWLNNGTASYTNGANGSIGHNGAVLGTSTDRSAFWLLLPAVGDTILDSVVINQRNTSNEQIAGFTTTGYSLSGGSSGSGTNYQYIDGMGQTRAQFVAPGTSINVCASAAPTAFAGSGNGTATTTNAITCTTGQTGTGSTTAATINGMSLAVVTVLPSTTDPNTIYFITS